MPKLTTALPKYRHHKASGQAVVTLGGKDHYLGPWKSHASVQEYDRLLSVWQAHGRQLPPNQGVGVTVAEVLVRYLEHADRYYVKGGEPTTEPKHIRAAIGPLSALYERHPAADFGPLALKAVRQRMIENGWCRTGINQQIGRIKRIFKWAVENELVAGEVYHRLQAMAGLRRGRSDARESEPVKPVAEAHVQAALEHVSAQVKAMIELQMLTGMRSGELCIMRACDLDTSGNVWTYTPSTHKTEHHGIERPIFLGPKAQEIVKAFLKPDTQAYLFDPRDAEALRNANKRAGRKTPMTPSQRARTRKSKPRVAPQDHYTTGSYRRAIARACRKADRLAHKKDPTIPADRVVVPQWHPHQLRHNAATRLRKEFGIESARVVLGHRSTAVTEIYAEIDKTKAADVMGKVG